MKIEVGAKLNLKRNAVITSGHSEDNPVKTREINYVYYFNNKPDWFTFKGMKTEFRLCGNRIYSITGPTSEYLIIEN